MPDFFVDRAGVFARLVACRIFGKELATSAAAPGTRWITARPPALNLINSWGSTAWGLCEVTLDGVYPLSTG